MKNFSTEITRWKNNARAALTLTFDGCYASTWESAVDILARYHMSSTWFLVTETAGGVLQGRPVVTWEKLKKRSELVEIASHTVTHPRLRLPFRKRVPDYICSPIRKFKKLFTSNLAQKIKRVGSNIYRDWQGVTHLEVLSEAKESKITIERYLNLKGVVSFAYPGGRYNSSLKKGVAGLGYLSARSTEDGYNFPNSLDFYALKSKVWNFTIDAEKANKWVDNAVKKGAWLIETYHVVSQGESAGYYYDTTISHFDAHLFHIASQNIWVDTQENIVKYIKEKNASTIKLDITSGEKIVLFVENNLDPETYNQVLTLRMVIPPTWAKVEVKQADNVKQLSPIRENNDSCIYFNVLPSKSEFFLTCSR